MSRRHLPLWIVLVASSIPGCADSVPDLSPSGEKTASASRQPSTPSPPENRPAFHFDPLAGAEPQRTFQGQGPRFHESAAERGLVHTYQNGAIGQLLMVESIGGGVGWLDMDADGFPDVYFVQGGRPDGTMDGRPTDRLFRNVGHRFVDVTEVVGLDERGYGQGVAVGDCDGDGFDDVYVTNVGANTFYRNNGDGTITEATHSAGVRDSRWSSSAAWADLNGDSFSELYVCNYLEYDPYDPFPCEKDGLPALCHPRQIDAWPDELFLNKGDGTFDAAAQRLGTFGPGNKGLGVAIAHFNDDDLPDIYVCNDTTANFLFINTGDGFREAALDLGVGLNASGDAEASMGVATGDYDGDGQMDLYLTHFTNESNTLYRNIGVGGFRDVTGAVGLHALTMPRLGFGVVMRDFNCDGQQDILTANGHIDHNNADGDGFKQLPQMLTVQDGTWFDVSETAGPYFAQRRVARGVAVADFDQDGDWDVLTGNQNAPAALLVNESEGGHRLKLRLVGVASERQGIGARLSLTFGETTQSIQLTGGTSFASTHQPVLIVGLGDAASSGTVTIKWPSGTEQVLNDVRPDQSLIIVEGRRAFTDPASVQ
ncbi:MAG TPA: hypothetical protein EYQ63_02125 [Fuerstia sp.]|nr:hypothetical protein [Fuerstiella sp.]